MGNFKLTWVDVVKCVRVMVFFYDVPVAPTGSSSSSLSPVSGSFTAVHDDDVSCLFSHFFSGSDAGRFFLPPRYFLPIMILDSCLPHTLNFSQTFFTTPPFMYLCLNFRCIAAANKCVAPFSGSLSITAIFSLGRI